MIAHQRPTRSLLFALMLLVLAALGMGLAGRTAAPAEAHPEQQAGAQPEPDCRGTARTTVTGTGIACTQRVRVEATAHCGSCAGGLNVVFVQPMRAREAGWMVEESLRAMHALESIEDRDVRVAVIQYDDENVRLATRMTDTLRPARLALRRPTSGQDAPGDFENAARTVLKELKAERRRHEVLPCELVIFFASAPSVLVEAEQRMLKAARMISREGIPLIAGCPVTDPDHCRATKSMPDPRRYYSEAPHARMAAFVDAEAQGQGATGLAEMTLIQSLPPRVRVVDGSVDPPPSTINWISGMTTTLRWDWARADMGPSLTTAVTYELRAEAPGEYGVLGDLWVTDHAGLPSETHLGPTMISFAAPCPTPAPPTPLTPVPTASPTSTPTRHANPTPTATGSHLDGRLYIPALGKG